MLLLLFLIILLALFKKKSIKNCFFKIILFIKFFISTFNIFIALKLKLLVFKLTLF